MAIPHPLSEPLVELIAQRFRVIGDVSPLGLGATAAAAGLILAISPRAPDLLYDARTFALVIAAVGLVNLALSVKPTPNPAT